jgi:hypothetical protein
MKSILDPSFQYTPSHQTDVRKTFEHARRGQETAWVETRTARDSTPVRLQRPSIGQSRG